MRLCEWSPGLFGVPGQRLPRRRRLPDGDTDPAPEERCAPSRDAWTLSMSSPSKERRSWHSPNIASVAVALALFVVALLIAVSGPQYDVTLLVTVGLSAVAAMGLTL